MTAFDVLVDVFVHAWPVIATEKSFFSFENTIMAA